MKKLILFIITLCMAGSAEAATVTWEGDESALWSVDGNWDTGSKPANGDSVVMNNSANCVMDVNTANLNSFDMTGYTGTLSGASRITVAPNSGAVTCLFAGTVTWTGDLYLIPEAGETVNFTPPATSLNTILIGSDPGHQGTTNVISALTIGVTKTLTLYAGTLNLAGSAGLTHSIGALSSSNSNTRTLTLGDCTLGLTGNNLEVLDLTTATGLTVTPNTAIINATASNCGIYISSAGWTGTTINMTGSGGVTFYGNNGSIGNLNRTGTAAKTDLINIYSNVTVTSTLTLAGNSATNRLQVRQSSSPGTQRTITVTGATVNCSNVDFRDIAFSPAQNLASIDGGSGDCGGNSGITFTEATTQTATMSSNKNWSDVTIWTSRVPLPQDNVSLAGVAGVTITADMPRLGKSIDWTGASGNPIFNNAVVTTFYGSMTFIPSLTILGNQFNWEGRGSFTFTSAGKSLPNQLNIAGVGGTLTLQDAFRASNTVYFQNGTLNANGYNLTCSTFTDNASGATKSLLMGGGTFTVTGTGGCWTLNASGTTLNAGASAIVLSDTSSTAKTFAGGGRTYNNLSAIGGGTGAVIITGSNSFNVLTVGAPKTLTLTDGTTQTVNDFVAQGSPSNRITLNAVGRGAPPILKKATAGIIQTDYLNIQGVNVTPANQWYMGNGSVGPVGLSFDGDNAYVEVPNSPEGNQLYGATAMSGEAWFIPRTLGEGGTARLFQHGAATTLTSGYALFLNTGNVINLRMHGDEGALRSVNTTTTVSLNTLNHVFWTWTTGSAAKIYLAGTECSYSTQNALTTPTDDSASTLRIGNGSDTSRTWDGIIVCVRIYRGKNGSPADALTAYLAGPKASRPVAGCTQEFLFLEGSGNIRDTLSDAVGTVSGASWANTGWLPGEYRTAGWMGDWRGDWQGKWLGGWRNN
jgi:hypothetical protein